MSAENVAELQVYEKKMQAGQVNAQLAQQMGLANLSNEQSAAMFNAQIDANMDIKQFDANQQVQLANSQFMQTMTVKNMDNRQQAAMQNATAMASMDMIKLAGGEPANFLDVGGGATPEKIVKAFRLITMDKKVKVILVNIFAGINRCDWVAEGIVQALEKIEIKVPLVIRLAGTNVEKGNKILRDSKLNYIEANTLEDAANKAVAALKK